MRARLSLTRPIANAISLTLVVGHTTLAVAAPQGGSGPTDPADAPTTAPAGEADLPDESPADPGEESSSPDATGTSAAIPDDEGVPEPPAADDATDDDAADDDATDDATEDDAADDDEAWRTASAERRDGFNWGFSLGVGLGAANGYPNDALKRGRDQFYTESGLGFGSSFNLWLGGALTDYLNVGAGFQTGQILSDGLVSGAGAVFLRVETFPVYWAGGAYRDLGVGFDFGTGGATTTPEDDEDELLIDGGGVSYLNASAFWEGIRFWKFGAGPFAGVHYMWSPSVRRPMALVGWRMSLYTSP